LSFRETLGIAGLSPGTISSGFSRGSRKPVKIVGRRLVSYGDKRTQTIDRHGLLIFNPVTALDVLLLSFFETPGSGAHTNSECHVGVPAEE